MLFGGPALDRSSVARTWCPSSSVAGSCGRGQYAKPWLVGCFQSCPSLHAFRCRHFSPTLEHRQLLSYFFSFQSPIYRHLDFPVFAAENPPLPYLSDPKLKTIVSFIPQCFALLHGLPSPRLSLLPISSRSHRQARSVMRGAFVYVNSTSPSLRHKIADHLLFYTVSSPSLKPFLDQLPYSIGMSADSCLATTVVLFTNLLIPDTRS